MVRIVARVRGSVIRVACLEKGQIDVVLDLEEDPSALIRNYGDDL